MGRYPRPLRFIPLEFRRTSRAPPSVCKKPSGCSCLVGAEPPVNLGSIGYYNNCLRGPAANKIRALLYLAHFASSGADVAKLHRRAAVPREPATFARAKTVRTRGLEPGEKDTRPEIAAGNSQDPVAIQPAWPPFVTRCARKEIKSPRQPRQRLAMYRWSRQPERNSGSC
jgi:hypothetical protein